MSLPTNYVGKEVPRSIVEESIRRNTNTVPVLDRRNPESVAAVQRYLIDNGYLTEEAARGGWGPKSQAAYDYANSLKETTLSDRLSENIPWISKATSLIGQIGDHALNQGSRIIMGIKEDPNALGGPFKWIKAANVGTIKGNELADKVESGELDHEKLLNTSFLGNTNLTNAEKRQALAILTYRNNNQPVNYESYLADVKTFGKNPGDWIGVDEYPYHFSNRQEDKRKMEQTSDSGIFGSIIQTGKRMFHDPNRGRLGSWNYRITPDGNIEISDRFEGTEQVAAKGKNDSEDYSLARKLWFRGTTHDLNGNISPRQQERWYRQAQEKD